MGQNIQETTPGNNLAGGDWIKPVCFLDPGGELVYAVPNGVSAGKWPGSDDRFLGSDHQPVCVEPIPTHGIRRLIHCDLFCVGNQCVPFTAYTRNRVIYCLDENRCIFWRNRCAWRWFTGTQPNAGVVLQAANESCGS